MGIETATLALIAGVVGGGATVLGGVQQQKAANAQAQATLNEAAYAADEAKARAEKIRRAGRSQIGAQKAALAASGVKLGEGTALEIEKDTITRVEEDALSSLITGRRIEARGEQEANALRRAGRNALTNSVLSAASQSASAGYKYKMGG